MSFAISIFTFLPLNSNIVHFSKNKNGTEIIGFNTSLKKKLKKWEKKFGKKLSRLLTRWRQL